MKYIKVTQCYTDDIMYVVVDKIDFVGYDTYSTNAVICITGKQYPIKEGINEIMDQLTGAL